MNKGLEATIHQWIMLNMHHSLGGFLRYTREKNLSLPQLRTLIHLLHASDCNISNLGAKFGVTNAASSQLMEKLVQQGYVERREDPLDRRKKVLELTDEGREIALEGVRARQSWLSNLVKALNPEEQEQVQAALILMITRASELD